jgi:hypothetical protein
MICKSRPASDSKVWCSIVWTMCLGQHGAFFQHHSRYRDRSVPGQTTISQNLHDSVVTWLPGHDLVPCQDWGRTGCQRDLGTKDDGPIVGNPQCHHKASVTSEVMACVRPWQTSERQRHLWRTLAHASVKGTMGVIDMSKNAWQGTGARNHITVDSIRGQSCNTRDLMFARAISSLALLCPCRWCVSAFCLYT